MPAPATMTQICCLEKLSVVALEAQKPKPTAAMAHPKTTARLAPFAVEHPAAHLGEDDEPDEEEQQEHAGLRRRLVQGDLCVLAGEEEHRDEGHHRDEQHEVLHGEGPDAEDRHLDERGLRVQLDEHEEADDHQAGDDADPGPRVAPAPENGLLEPEDAQPDPCCDEDRAAVVDRRPPVLGLRLRDRDQDQRDQRRPGC